MTNTNIQGPVSLSGRGFVAKRNHQYDPGEYLRLHNAEIVDEKVTKRRDIRAVSTGVDYPVGASKFYNRAIGNIGEYVIYVNEAGDQTAVSDTDTISMFNIYDPFKFGGTGFFYSDAINNHRLLFFFNYNKTNYWVYGHLLTRGIELLMVYCQESENNLPSDYTSGMLLWSEWSSLYWSITNEHFDFHKMDFNNWLIFGDRLWVCMTDGIYFSKATDPRQFDVTEGGGFFKFPDVTVNYMVSVRDTIYVICDTAIYTVTYNTDPNTDATVRRISDIGGEHAVIYRDTPYFINTEGVWSITNGYYIDKVMNSDLDTGLNNFDAQTLTVFEEYIIINKYFKDADPTPLLRYNRYPDGFISSTHNLANYTSSTGGTLTLDATDSAAPTVFIPDPGAGISDNCLRMTGLNTLTYMSFSMITPTTVDNAIKVEPGAVYVISFWVKTNIVQDVKPVVQFDAYTSAFGYTQSGYSTDAEYDPVYAPGGNPEFLINSASAPADNGWVRFYAVWQAYWDAEYVRFRIFNYKMSGGNITAAEYVKMDLITFERTTDINLPTMVPEGVSGEYYGYNALGTMGNEVIHYDSVYPFTQDCVRWFEPGLQGNDLGFNTYFLNMDNGAVHTVSVPRAMDDTTLAFNNNNHIIDLYYNKSDSQPKLYILTCDKTTGDNNWYVMNAERFSDVYDEAMPAGVRTRYRPQVLIDIEGVVPDGNRYQMKKFRSLEIQGIFPVDNFKMLASVNNSDFVDANAISIVDDETLADTTRPHYPRRIGLNVRGQWINFRFRTDVSLIGVAGEWSEFELSDMRVLWGYLGRGPTTKQLT